MNENLHHKKTLNLRSYTNPIEQSVTHKEPKYMLSSNQQLDQSQKLEAWPYTISHGSKKSHASKQQQNSMIGDIFGEDVIKDIQNIKASKNQKLSLADIFFKIKFKAMARRLLSSTRSFMYKNLNLRQFKQIDDKAWGFEKNDIKISKTSKIGNFLTKSGLKQSYSGLNAQKTMIKRNETTKKSENLQKIFAYFASNQLLQRIMKAFDRKFPVMDPISIQKIIWDFLNIILILVYTIQIPLFITFPQQKPDQTHWAMIISVPIFIFIDLLFTLNTGCYLKGSLIKKRLTLINLNMKKRIIPSLLIILFYMLFISLARDQCLNNQPTSRWLDILLIPLFQKLIDIGQIINKLEENQTLSKKRRNIIALVKLILQIVYIGHMIACFWVMVAQFEDQNNSKTWVKYPVFEDVLWYQLYIDAYYFTTVTMITVGYGDIIPITEIEKTICIIIMIFSCGVFAYSMNTIGAILESFYEDSKKLTQNMQIINSYMTRKNVGKQTKNQIREYLYYYWKEESERDQDAEDKIINILSDNLKKNLLMESKNVVLKKSSIFRSNFSDDVKEKIAPLIKEYRCYPEETICLEGEPDDCSIYFIEKGSVEIFLEQRDHSASGIKSIASLGKGQSFGETSFFTGRVRSASVRSREFTTLLILNRSEFLSVLINHQQDYEKFCALKDSLSLYENYQLINVQCLSCQSFGHQILKCPYLHFTVNHTKLQDDFIRNPSQERNKCKRVQRKSNSVINIHVVVQKAFDYDDDNYDCIEYQYLNEFYEDIYTKFQEDELKLSNIEKSNLDMNGLMNLRDQSQDASIATTSENESQMYENRIKSSSIKDINRIQEEDEIDGESENFNHNIIDRKCTIYDQLSIIKEICNSPLMLDSKGNNLKHLQEEKTLLTNSPDRLRQGQRINSYFEKQATNGSLESRPQNKKLTMLNMNDRRGYLNQILGDNTKKRKPTFQQPESIFYRQKSRKITNISQPQKNAETFKNFMAKGSNLKSDEIFKSIGIKSSANQDIKRKGRKETRKQINLKNNINNNPNNSPNALLPHQITGGSGEKRRYSQLNSADFKKLNSSLFNPGKEEQKQEVQASQTQIEYNQQDENCEEVEDHFDCMQNFAYYFPLNNFSYQLSLMKLDTNQKKQIMFRAYYENVNNMKQANVSDPKINNRDKKLSNSFQNRNNKQFGTVMDISSVEGDLKEKSLNEMRKSKFFNQKTLIAQSLNKLNSEKTEKRDRSESIVLMGSTKSFQSLHLKNATYRFSINKKQDFNKNNSLHNKPTNSTITDINLNFDFQNSSLGNNLVKEKECDLKPNNMAKEIALDPQSLGFVQESEQIKKFEQNSSKYDDEDEGDEEKEKEVLNNYNQSQISLNKPKNQIQSRNNHKQNINLCNSSIFNDQHQVSNNTFITFENNNLTRINDNQKDHFIFENSFQEDNYTPKVLRDQDLDDIQSELDQSKNSIKFSNLFVTQKRKSQHKKE